MRFVTTESSTPPLNSCQNCFESWVTVICICYNHQEYVVQALQSVVEQDYPKVELIVIDNGSTDRSTECINEFIRSFPAIRFIRNSINLGLNRAFNQGLAMAQGKYIIDLSADDILLPSRIARQVHVFEQLPDQYGVIFSNAAYINADSQEIGLHYPIDKSGHALVSVPSGAVFKHILEAYFICTPTMMMRRDMLNELGGYDETLSYEDFDLWVRSSRHYQYAYIDDVLTQKRQLPNALSTQIKLPNNRLLSSTLVVCQKALRLCDSPDEFQALAARIQTFIRKAFYAEQFELAKQFGQLLHQITRPDALTSVILVLSHLRLPTNSLYRQYLKYHSKPD